MSSHYYYGIYSAADRAIGLAAALTYWVFRCRKSTSPAMGIKTWTFLESSIKNAAQSTTTIEGYLQRLSDYLHAHLRPAVLTEIVQPEQRIVRINNDLSEIKEMEADKGLVFVSWLGLLDDAAQDGFTEWDILDTLRTRPTIIQVLCRIRFEEDRAMGKEVEPEEPIDVDVLS